MAMDWTDEDLRTDLQREAAPLARRMTAAELDNEHRLAWVRFAVAERATRNERDRLASDKHQRDLLAEKVKEARRELAGWEKRLAEAQAEMDKAAEAVEQAERMAREAKHWAEVYAEAYNLLLYGPGSDEELPLGLDIPCQG